MRTLFLPRAEATVIRSLTSGDERVASWLMPRLTKDHFSFEPTAEFFRRIKFLTHKDGEIPRWEDLVDDMSIGEDMREELSTNPGEVIESRREARLLLDRLDKYRRARVLMEMSRAAARGLKSDRVDVDALQDELGDLLSKSRGTGNMEESMFSFGGPKYDRTMIREILQDTRDEFIPTGFKAFDSENQGVPRGSLHMVGGQTGAGKCSRYDTPIVTSEGVVDLGSVWDTFKTEMDVDGFKPADRVLLVKTHTGAVKRVKAAYKTRGRPMRVTFSNGAQVVGLPEHKLWILNAEGIPEFKRLDALALGDRAPISDVEAALIQLSNEAL